MVIHGFNTLGPIISNLVCELTFNPLLFFHHVVHIPKYSLLDFKVEMSMMDLPIPCGYCVFCYRFVNGGALRNATFKPRYTNVN